MSTQQPTQAIAPTAAGTVTREEFGARELQVSAETASSAAAAQAQAIVQARYVMALRRPRDWDDVRARILKEVERPGFAEVAWYRKPVGQGVEGLSIRFAEAAMRCMGNLLPEAPIIYDDPKRRILRVTLTDLESNLTWTKDVVVEKTVERRSLRKGQVALAVRTNSQGETTYLVEATEDELAAKEGSAVSKVMRNHSLRILPGDIQDECKRRILDIRRGEAAKDPDGARKKILDAFAAMNVMPSDLKKYLGHDVATSSPAEIQDLRDLYSAIHSGETSWADALAEKVGEAVEEKPAAKPGIEGVTERLAGQGGAAPAATAEPKKDCLHPAVPPSRLAGGKVIVCPDCGTSLREEPAEADGMEAAAEPTEDARAAVEKLAKAADKPRGKSSQRQIEE